jgi:hypothetical protein
VKGRTCNTTWLQGRGGSKQEAGRGKRRRKWKEGSAGLPGYIGERRKEAGRGKRRRKWKEGNVGLPGNRGEAEGRVTVILSSLSCPGAESLCMTTAFGKPKPCKKNWNLYVAFSAIFNANEHDFLLYRVEVDPETWDFFGPQKF